MIKSEAKEKIENLKECDIIVINTDNNQCFTIEKLLSYVGGYALFKKFGSHDNFVNAYDDIEKMLNFMYE